jgi:uncharacterized protein (TIGR03067 family)
MRPVLALALLLAVTPLWADDDPEPPATGAKEIEGTWVVSSLRAKNLPAPVPPEALKKMKMTFAKGKMVVANGGDNKEGTYKLDPRKKPAHIDMTPKGEAKTVRGIYKVEKGKLTLCIKVKGGEGKERAKGFDDDDAITMVLTKVKK